MVSCLADINEILYKVNKTKHMPIRKKAKRHDITKYFLVRLLKRSILVMRFECRYMDTELVISITDISM